MEGDEVARYHKEALLELSDGDSDLVDARDESESICDNRE